MTITDNILDMFQLWGYTDSEGRFLYLIATQSGYFFHKHYADFLNIAPNKRTTALIRKALDKRHIIEREYHHGHYRLYHLYARRVYESLDLGNSNLRKHGSFDFATTRLMVTSFVTDFPEEDYFSSEEEKVRYFTEVRGIPLHVLPQGQFRNRSGQELVTRYFVEKFPMFPEERDDPNSALVFTFFDTHFEGLAPSVNAFKTFLNSYRGLFLALHGNFKLMYVYRSDVNLTQAENFFKTSFNQSLFKPNRTELLRHFTEKLNAEVLGFGRVPQTQVSQADKEPSRFAGMFYENLYQQWKVSQTIPDNALAQLKVCQPQFSIVYEPY